MNWSAFCQSHQLLYILGLIIFRSMQQKQTTSLSQGSPMSPWNKKRNLTDCFRSGITPFQIHIGWSEWLIEPKPFPTFLPSVSLTEMLNINKILPTMTQKTHPRKSIARKILRNWFPLIAGVSASKTIFESAYVNRLEMGQKSEHQSEFRHHRRVL